MRNTMNKWFAIQAFFIGLLMLTGQAVSAATDDFGPKHKLVIQVSTDDKRTQAIALNNAVNMQKALGQTVIIDNKGGAGGNLAHDYVAKQPPDGHTALFSSNNQMLYPFLVAKLGYDPAAFVPIGFVAKQESVFVGSADAPWADLAEIGRASCRERV